MVKLFQLLILLLLLLVKMNYFGLIYMGSNQLNG